MGAQSLLDQLLRSGRSALDGATQAAREAGRSGDLGKYATGAAVGGVLGLLLGSDSGRRLGGKALKLGSVAAIGALAWKAYQDHQAGQRDAASATSAPAAARPSSPAQLPGPQPEQHGRALLKALIAAAKSDGHMDERERGLVQAELNRLEDDPELRRWFDDELRRPLDPAEVAAAATTPELAAEIYLASLVVVDTRTTMERAYLDELARGLNLAPGLKADLEARAAAPA
jgi:uncharacterized membrane protein YebE (DUF533 family)